MEIEQDELSKIISQLSQSYSRENRGIEVTVLGNRLKLVTKKNNKQYIQKLVDLVDNDTLSQSALETLAIIAYNQPITRLNIDEIRGVSSSHMIRKLVSKNLIYEIGRSETAGRPILYGTTSLFLDYFGLKTIKDLPEINISVDDSEKDLYSSKYNEENL